jgi:hypothetical protein
MGLCALACGLTSGVGQALRIYGAVVFSSAHRNATALAKYLVSIHTNSVGTLASGITGSQGGSLICTLYKVITLYNV